MSKNRANKTDVKPDSTLEDSTLELEHSIKSSTSQESSKSEDSGLESHDTKALSSRDQNEGKSAKTTAPSFFSRLKWGFFWVILLGAVLTALLFTRKDLDWQVQHINDLQFKVAQLEAHNQTLEKRLDTHIQEANAQFQTVNDRFNAPENRAVMTQADIEQLKDTTQHKLQQLQEAVGRLGEQATQKITDVMSDAKVLADTTEEMLQSSDEFQPMWTQVEQNLQSQLNDVAGKLAELFEFKQTQQKNLHMKEELNGISLSQIKQWIIEINTQWLLQGSVEETQAQLLALQKAILVHSTDDWAQLKSFIAQDLAYLERYQIAQHSLQNLDFEGLKQAIKALEYLPSNEKFPALDVETGGGKNEVAKESIRTFESAFEEIKQSLSQMVSIKKRESDQEMTRVESLILRDVLIQRAGLLVDRIEWAIISHDPDLLIRSVNDLQSYIQHTFPEHRAQFEALLTPFLAQTLPVRKSLAIMHFLQSQKRAPTVSLSE